jgi:hypothetical protein
MKSEHQKSRILSEVKEEYRPPTTSDLLNGGCVMGCMGPFAIGLIILGAGVMGMRPLDGPWLLIWLVVAWYSVALALTLWMVASPGLRRKRRENWRAARIESIESLIQQIEESRKRMSDRGYRNKLRQKGFWVRGDYESEPSGTAEEIEQFRARIRQLKLDIGPKPARQP